MLCFLTVFVVLNGESRVEEWVVVDLPLLAEGSRACVG